VRDHHPPKEAGTPQLLYHVRIAHCSIPQPSRHPPEGESGR
jgi:hypothetical protein